MTGGGTIVLAIQPFVPKDVVGIEDTTLAALQASPEKLQSTVGTRIPNLFVSGPDHEKTEQWLA